MVLLLCAGLGWHDRDDISEDMEDQLNEFLEKVWRTLKRKVLSRDGDGYKLNILESTKFEIAGEEFLCPVSNRLLDKVFMGYSPWIKGNLTEENLNYYKIDNTKSYSFPTYSHPFHLDKQNTTISKNEVEEWLEENSQTARDKGLWK